MEETEHEKTTKAPKNHSRSRLGRPCFSEDFDIEATMSEGCLTPRHAPAVEPSQDAKGSKSPRPLSASGVKSISEKAPSRRNSRVRSKGIAMTKALPSASESIALEVLMVRDMLRLLVSGSWSPAKGKGKKVSSERSWSSSSNGSSNGMSLALRSSKNIGDLFKTASQMISF